MLSPLSDHRSHMVNGHGPYGTAAQHMKNHYHGPHMYGNRDRVVPLPRHQKHKHKHYHKSRQKHQHQQHGGHYHDDNVSVYSADSAATGTSLNSRSTVQNSRRDLLAPTQTQPQNAQLTERQKLQLKIQQQKALAQQHAKGTRRQQTQHTFDDVSVIYTEETRFSDNDDDDDEVETEQKVDDDNESLYAPSIFTDISYQLDYDADSIQDVVWAQKMKYLKTRLVFLEEQLQRLPAAQRRLDKLMLYTALEFLSVNPDELKANADVVDWWDRYKYAFLDRHDPHKEDTLHSQNWDEIGIPLSRSPGATPAHHDKTIFEDIYTNLCRKQWLDPLSLQHTKYGHLSLQRRGRPQNDKILPSTVKFAEERYRDYDAEEDVLDGGSGALCVSYLIDGGDFLQFLRRQTTGQLAREKGGLVGYVNVSVEDKVAECTPWRLARTFRTSVNNRMAYEHNKKLAAQEKALRLSLQRKQDELDAVRRRLEDEQLARDEQRAQFESEMEAVHRSYSSQRRPYAKEQRERPRAHTKESAQFANNRSAPHPNQPDSTGSFAPNQASQSHHVLGVAHSHGHVGRYHNHSERESHEGHHFNGYGGKISQPLHKHSSHREHGRDTHGVAKVGSSNKRWSPMYNGRSHASALQSERERDSGKMAKREKLKTSKRAHPHAPSPVPRPSDLSSLTMSSGRSKGAHSSGKRKRGGAHRSNETWWSYVDRAELIAARYPDLLADRNLAWQQWTAMLDERDKHPTRQLSESALWSYIDLARLSISRYANYIWWPDRPDLITKQNQQQQFTAKAKGKRTKKVAEEETSERTRISDTQYYDHRLNLIWTKKFAIVMDFNLFLFDAYANPSNIEETLALSHSLLSLAAANNVVVSKKNKKDFYLNTSGKKKSTRQDQQYRYLQFRCDGKDGDDDDAQRSEWMEELDYQIHIVHDLLAIPGIKLKVADPNGTVWLPAPANESGSEKKKHDV